MTISIINYGCGDIGSIVNMLKHIGGATEVISELGQVEKAVKIMCKFSDHCMDFEG